MQRRPAMFVKRRDLLELEALLRGYEFGFDAALSGVGQLSFMSTFLEFVHRETRSSVSCGWALALERLEPDIDERWEKFFGLVGRYRVLLDTGDIETLLVPAQS